LQAITPTHTAKLLLWLGCGAVARDRNILGVHYGIIKLCTTGQGLFDTTELEYAYHATRACDKIQTEGEAKNKIVGSTM